MLGLQNKKRIWLFFGLFSISLLALANTNLETTRSLIAKAISNWEQFQPNSLNGENLSFDDWTALQDQQELNSAAKQALNPSQFDELGKESLDLLGGIDSVTTSTLKEKSWAIGKEAAKKGGPSKEKNAEKAIQALSSNAAGNNANGAGQGNNGSSDSGNTSGGTGSLNEFNRQLDEQKALLIILDLRANQWNLTKKNKRAEYDQNFIKAILTSVPDYTEALSTFAARLTQVAVTGDFIDLHAELLMLHIYLRPTHGLRLLNLGLRGADSVYTSNSDQNAEDKGNVALARAAALTASTHIENHPQALSSENPGLQKLIAALTKIISDHGATLTTLDNGQRELQTAVALTAVIFDLFNYGGSQEAAKSLASSISAFGILWDYRTCWYVQPNGSERAATCTTLLNDQIATLDIIIDEDIRKKENRTLVLQNDYVAHQLSYGAHALRLMTGKPVMKWRKTR